MHDDHTFSLCLTHDVDRPYKTYQSLYYALAERDPDHLRPLVTGANPYWQFEDVMALERELGVRSAFYFLSEQRLFRDRPIREWFSLEHWKLFAGRYDVDDPRIVDVMRRLDAGGWEVGLHGSYESYRDPARLAAEKDRVEAALGQDVTGGRQHYLNLEVPETWQHQAAAGLAYDSSLGSSTTYGFEHGYDVLRPLETEDFVVFPLTLMENALPDPGEHFERAWAACEQLLEEAAENDAVMTVLWHPNKFSERDYPGMREIYRRLIEHALDMGAWVGPPAEYYREQCRTDGVPARR
ncbi:MAG: polysaccharide deacetylase family protein [Haloarculaceae archaeon]